MFRFLKNISFITAINLILLSNCFAIKELSKDELKNQTAQAGMTVAIDNAVVYHENESLKFIDADETDPGYLGFKDIKFLNTMNTGPEGNGVMGHLTLDIASPEASDDSYSNPYVSVKCGDWQTVSFLKVGTIDFFENEIGSLDIAGIKFPEWNLYLGAHGAGIDFEAGFKAEIDSFEYKYGPPADNFSLGFDNLYMANSFYSTQDADEEPSETSTWISKPSTWVSEGRFKVGDFENNKPATFDIGVIEETGLPAISLSTPMSGSVRMKNVHIGNSDFGPAAIDGIQVHSMKIELPGRNLGMGN